jgi:MFS family permease
VGVRLSDAQRLMAARALRGFGDGLVSVLLPAWLVTQADGAEAVGRLTAGTLLGSALATLALGWFAARIAARRVLFAATALLIATGFGLAFAPSFGWLLLVGFAGTFNPSAGDVSVFLPTEQALLAGEGSPAERAARFARYNVAGAAGGALGAFAAGWPERVGISLEAGAELACLCYAMLGVPLALLYRGLRAGRAATAAIEQRRPLQRSRNTVFSLAALFSLDSFGGGFAVQTIVVAWLLARFDASLASVGAAMGVAQLLSAASQLAAPPLARRIGLIRTMVYTHIPANLFLIASAFAPSAPIAIALVWLRSSLSQMDVPARQAYVMSIVPEDERSAAASVTNVPRSLASAASPWLAGSLLGAGPIGWPFVLGGSLKLAYDLLLLARFRKRPAPGEPSGSL